MRPSNSASCASRLVPQHHCSSLFTTERCSLQEYPRVFLGVVHNGFSALSLTCDATNYSLIITLNILFSHHHPQPPYSRVSCIILLYHYTSDPESVPWRLLGSMPASHRYKVHPCPINTHGDRPPF